MTRKIEVLAPAGSLESLRAAVAAGADAVYMGGSRFGARAYAENPDEDGLLEALDYVHLHGRKLYLTVNTLVKDGELPDLFPWLLPYYERGVDAVLVQDMGVLRELRNRFPDLPLHASTQMTVTGPAFAKQLSGRGIVRAVPARELSLQEIRAIADTGMEVECFVHGALCFSYSGQCLMSSMIGGRSGNRGRCAQTCRLPFRILENGSQKNRRDELYVLSLKDLCTLDILPEILDAGVCSLKIEGRMKSPRYTAGVVSIYRKYVDRYLAGGGKNWRVDPEDRKLLLDLFDRGGFTEGYYRQHNGREMAVRKEKPAFRKENREWNDYIDKTWLRAEPSEPCSGAVTVREGKPVVFCVTHKATGTRAERAGTIAESAVKQALTGEQIKKQFQKTGGTAFSLEELSVDLEGKVFLPVQEMNRLRRETLEELRDTILRGYRRTVPPDTFREGTPEESPEEEARPDKPVLTVSVRSRSQLAAALSEPLTGEIYLDAAAFAPEQWEEAVSGIHEAGKKARLLLPAVWRKEAGDWYRKARKTLLNAGFDGLVYRSAEEIPIFRDFPAALPPVADANLYTMNRLAEEEYRDLFGTEKIRFTISRELNSREIGRHGSEGRELIVYGRTPLMVTAQCFRKSEDGCSAKSGWLELRDRMGKCFPVKNECRFCYNTIYNSAPVSLLGESRIIAEMRPAAVRVSLTAEDGREAEEIIRAFADVFLRGLAREQEGETTRGHFRRGVE